MPVRTILKNGSPDNRIDIVILGDGYKASEISSKFTSDAQNMVNYLFGGSLLSEPFSEYAQYFNVHLIDIISNESGADNPSTGFKAETALDATYYFDGATERLLSINNDKADAALTSALSGSGIVADIRFVVVNDSKYGGAGGKYAVYAGGNEFSLEVALHEVGHSYAGVADEYGGDPSVFNGAEPNGVNISKDGSGAKWEQWLGYNQPGVGKIGAYEGGGYFDKGIYRPSESSKMRDLGKPFDAISREQFILKFYEDVDPLDTWTSNGGSLMLRDITDLSVSPISTDRINVDWYVEGVLTVTGRSAVTIDDLKLTAGTHNVSAIAADKTDWVRLDRTSLEQIISWQIELSNPTNGNDRFALTSGNDNIDGLLGLDTASFGVARAQVNVSSNGNTITAIGQGSDTLVNIERLVFTDGTLAFDTDGIAGQAYRIYKAAFNRTPDNDGLKFWIGELDKGMSLLQAASGFVGSAEFNSAYGGATNNLGIVQKFYQNVLGREGEAGGVSYWTGELDSGSKSTAQVLAIFQLLQKTWLVSLL
jgi:hypothetical protein